MVLKAVRQVDQIVVHFSQAGIQLGTGDQRDLKGFSVVDEKGIQKEVEAFLQKDKVVIPVTGKDKIAELRYGWEPFTRANLVNAAGLPASTFTIKVK